jgi:hypothetical protein
MTTTIEAPAPTTTTRRPIGTGVAAIGLTVLAFAFSVPDYPENITAQVAREYLTSNSQAFVLFGMASAASSVLLVVLAAFLRQRMTGTLRDVAFGSGLLVSVWMFLTGAFNASVGLDLTRAQSQPDEMYLNALGLQLAGDSLGSAATYAKGAFLLAVGIAAVKSRVLPKWLGWLSLVFGTMAVGAGLGVVGNSVSQVLFYGGLLGFAIWPLIVGVTVLVRKPTA